MTIRHICNKGGAAVCIAVFITACASSGGYSNSDSSGSGYGNTTTRTAAEDVKKTVTVTISNFAFEPATISVSPGDSIVFVNEDGAPHTATSDGGIFDTGTLAGGQSGSVTIEDAGTYDYFCAIHPAMKGSIVVR